MRIKGKCCPICTDSLSKGLCEYGNTFYAVGEEWRDGLCINCTCTEGGQTLCTQLECPPCQIPRKVQGRCCPVCEENISWSVQPTLYPADSSNYSQAHQINLILLFSVLGLALVIILAILTICLCYRRCRQEEKKKQQMEHNHHSSTDPLTCGGPLLSGITTLGAPQNSSPALTVTATGPGGLISGGGGSFSAKLLRVKDPRSEQCESLLSAASNGSTVSSTNGGTKPSANGTGANCARAASFNLKISTPCVMNGQDKRPRSCKV